MSDIKEIDQRKSSRTSTTDFTELSNVPKILQKQKKIKNECDFLDLDDLL